MHGVALSLSLSPVSNRPTRKYRRVYTDISRDSLRPVALSLSLFCFFFTSLILLLSLSPTLLTISIKIYPAILNRHPSRTSSSFECVLIQVYLRTSPIMFVAGKGSRRWPELTEIRILIMRTICIPYPVVNAVFAYFVVRTGRLSPQCLFISARHNVSSWWQMCWVHAAIRVFRVVISLAPQEQRFVLEI